MLIERQWHAFTITNRSRELDTAVNKPFPFPRHCGHHSAPISLTKELWQGDNLHRGLKPTNDVKSRNLIPQPFCRKYWERNAGKLQLVSNNTGMNVIE